MQGMDLMTMISGSCHAFYQFSYLRLCFDGWDQIGKLMVILIVSLELLISNVILNFKKLNMLS